MLTWYHLFIVGVVLLRCGATPRDRNALTVVLAATIASWLLVTFVTHGITGPWKLAIPGAVETATIWALLRWSRGRTGWAQVALVAVAWMTHLLCYIDLQTGMNMVYDNYGTILGVVSALQLAACYDTILHHLRRLSRWVASGASRRDTVLDTGVPAGVFHHSGDTSR